MDFLCKMKNVDLVCLCIGAIFCWKSKSDMRKANNSPNTWSDNGKYEKNET